eukprot:TRINITY_DN26853_c0_g1_i1.p1 TRINITY_DN26853_c0_g1~~TRINITY_DN26853_c0_g1_i1.p1  ORF type:complete len:278 (-),score=120.61 TRINITY_DN26853_c0_g1_i1:112-891(-)
MEEAEGRQKVLFSLESCLGGCQFQSVHFSNPAYTLKKKNKFHFSPATTLFFAVDSLEKAVRRSQSSKEDVHVPLGKDIEVEKLEKIMEKSKLNTFELEKAPKLDLTTQKQLKKQAKEARKKTAGTDWFGLSAPSEIDPETKSDLDYLNLRQYADPKKFWKKPDKVDPKQIKHFEIGKAVADPLDFYSEGRSKKKPSKKHFVDDLINDQETKKYLKRKMIEAADDPFKKRKRVQKKEDKRPPKKKKLNNKEHHKNKKEKK